MKANSKSLGLSVSSTQSTSKESALEQLKAGRFDIQKPLLQCDTDSPSDTFEFNESAIDAFLASENVYPVNLTDYRQALKSQVFSKEKISSDAAIISPPLDKYIEH